MGLAVNNDELNFVITLHRHKSSEASENNIHHLKVLIDDTEYSYTSFTEENFVGDYVVRFHANLSFGDHYIKINYRSEEMKGVLEVKNIYVSGPKAETRIAGLNLDSLVRSEGAVSYGHHGIKQQRTGIFYHGTYFLKFNSPIFYWILSKFPF